MAGLNKISDEIIRIRRWIRIGHIILRKERSRDNSRVSM